MWRVSSFMFLLGRLAMPWIRRGCHGTRHSSFAEAWSRRLRQKLSKLGSNVVRAGVVREIGVDIAKGVAIFLVVCLHVNDWGFSYSGNSPWLLLSRRAVHDFSYICVDLFALATGYLCIEARHRYSRLAEHWVVVVFWGCVMTLVGGIVTWHLPSFLQAVSPLLPILRDQYWYFTAYFYLFFIMPVLNEGLRPADKKSHMILLGAIGLFVCVYSTLPSGGDTLSLYRGYSVIWLTTVYVVGGQLRILWKGQLPTWSLIFGVVGFWGVTIALQYALPAKLSVAVCGYTSPLTFGMAILVFLLCLRVPVKGIRVRRFVETLSLCSFGIYLIHVQPYFWVNVWKRYLANVHLTSCVEHLVLTFSLSVVFTMVFMFMEWSRQQLFRCIGIRRCLESLFAKIARNLE